MKIETDEQHQEALDKLRKLFDEFEDVLPEGHSRIEELSTAIEAYENERWPMTEWSGLPEDNGE